MTVTLLHLLPQQAIQHQHIMATTITARPLEVPTRPATPPAPHLTLNTTFSGSPTRIPHKHIPFCSPGPAPSQTLPLSPPTTPSSSDSSSADTPASSLLHPPTGYPKLYEDPTVYGLTAHSLSEALHHVSTLPLPGAHKVFPWLHGLTAENQVQLSFFRGLNKNPVPPIPQCLRGVTIVKAGGNLSFSKLKGAIAPDELLLPPETCVNRHADHCEGGPCFMDADPLRGFSVRNFKIQCCKMATVSDIVVYGDDSTPRHEVEALASLVSRAQQTWQKKVDSSSFDERPFNTFLLTDSFEQLEADHPDLVACSSEGVMSDVVMDFPRQERIEMAELTKPSEIAHNVYLGQTPDVLGADGSLNADNGIKFDILIEAAELTSMPEQDTLDEIDRFFTAKGSSERGVAQISFPSSGSFGCHKNAASDVSGLLAMCRWMHKITTGKALPAEPKRGAKANTPADAEDTQQTQRRIYIHCSDGYTESSFLALCYSMYTECIPAREAWVRLHRDKGRNFFAYPVDKHFLESFERRIMWESPCPTKRLPPLGVPLWAKRMDGSLPSRITPYLYLGNLHHAENPGLLRQLGITHILSVGEPITWQQDPSTVEEDAAAWSDDKFCFVDKVQDNGVDPLTAEFDRCLDFIGELSHCLF